MKNLTTEEIEKKIKESQNLDILVENLIDAEDAGFEFGTSQILSSLPLWGEYLGDTQGIYSWDKSRVLTSEFILDDRCNSCSLAKWACTCD